MARQEWTARYASDGVTWCETAREYAAAENISTQAVYRRLKSGWPNPKGRPPKVKNITYRGKAYPDVRTAAEAEGVSVQAVRGYVDRHAKRDRQEAVPPLP